MTASSQWDANHAAWLARLHRPRRGRFMGAWSSRHKNHNQWLQIDMGRSMKVTGIATQGRQDADQWVTAYYIYVSSDGVNFAKVKHWWNYVKVECCRLFISLRYLVRTVIGWVHCLLYRRNGWKPFTITLWKKEIIKTFMQSFFYN